MSIKIVTLNIEGDKHLDKVIKLLKTEKPNVVCLQEILDKDFQTFKSILQMDGSFYPQVHIGNDIHFGIAKNVDRGTSLLSNLEIISQEGRYYVQNEHIPICRRWGWDDRVLALMQVQNNEGLYNVATTHFEFTRNGEPTKRQLKNMEALLTALQGQEDLIFAGDVNAPRGYKTYGLFRKFFDRDHVPITVASTLDPILHRANHRQYVVDTVLTKGGFTANPVRLVSGVSDHYALVTRARIQH